jgi:hypothetical protein
VVALIRGALLVCAAACGERASAPAIDVLAGVELEPVLLPAEVDQILAGAGAERAGPDLDLAPNGNVVMRAGDSLVEIATGDHVAVDRLVERDAPERFTIDGDTLLGIRGRMLGTLEHGKLTASVPLPVVGMQLASSTSPGTIYLFGGPPEVARRVYALRESGELDVLVELPLPIVAVADGSKAVYVATTDEVWRVRGERIELVTRVAAADAPITSIAVTPSERVLYLASRTQVLAMHGLAALPLVKRAGGELRWRLGSLWLWDPQRKLLARLAGAGDELVAGGAP